MHKHSPIWIAISPMAHVALLHTDMNSGLRLTPRTGMNSAGGGKRTTMTNWPAQHTQKQQLAWETGSPTVRLYSVWSKNTTHRCRASHEGNTPLSSLLAEQTNSVALLAWCPLIIWQIKHLGFVHTAQLAFLLLSYLYYFIYAVVPLYISLNCLLQDH